MRWFNLCKINRISVHCHFAYMRRLAQNKSSNNNNIIYFKSAHIKRWHANFFPFDWLHFVFFFIVLIQASCGLLLSTVFERKQHKTHIFHFILERCWTQFSPKPTQFGIIGSGGSSNSRSRRESHRYTSLSFISHKVSYIVKPIKLLIRQINIYQLVVP